MKDAKNRVLEVARETRAALISKWNSCGEGFVDSYAFKTRSAWSEAVGLVSLMLLYVSTSKEEGQWNDNDTAELIRVTQSSIPFIYDSVTSDGFTADPLFSSEDTEDLFDIDKQHGYIDTVTWVLSVSLLTRYAHKVLGLKLDKDIEEKCKELIALALGYIIKGQRSDGTWGFSSDASLSARSLYFTYTACVSLGDFYDYAMGEFSGYYDTELLEYLEKTIESPAKTINEVRDRVCNWVVHDALPLLPSLADCERLGDEDYKRLGIGTKQINENFVKKNGYIHLYYAYFLMDIIIVSGSDLYFKEKICTDADALKRLVDYYTSENLISSDDRAFYFPSEDEIAKERKKSEERAAEKEGRKVSYVFDRLAESIHLSRSNFLKAQRTGKSFWDSSSSELIIQWLSEDSKGNVMDVSPDNRNRSIITEPAFVPMALRANTNYSYYISEQTDITVKELFNLIVSDRSDTDNALCTSNLWDNLSYSLQVTERSVEAIVDYYDYVNKFSDNIVEVNSDNEAVSDRVQTVTETVRSPLDIAFEEKIKDFFTTDEGKAILADAVGKAPAAQPVAEAAVSDQAVIEKLKNIRADFMAITRPLDRYEESEELLYELVLTFEALSKRSLYERLAEQYRNDSKKASMDNLDGVINEDYEKLDERISALLRDIINDSNKPGGDLTELYSKLKNNI